MEKSGKKQLFINLFASVVVFATQFVIGFVLSPYIIAKLGEAANGFITLANNFTQYATLLTVAVNSMSNRFISYEYNRGNRKKAEEYFVSVFVINAICSVIITVVSMFVVVNLKSLIQVDDSVLGEVQMTFALSFINLVVSFLSTSYTSSTFVVNRMDINAVVQIGSNLLRLLVTVWLYMFFAPRIQYASVAVLCAGVFSAVFYVLLKKKLLPDIKLNFKSFSLKCVIQLARSGVWFLISNISSMLLNGLDVLIANIFISDIAMGRLSVSKTIPNAVGSLLGTLANMFAASFTIFVAQNDYEGLIKEIKFTCKILGLFLTVPFAGVIIYGVEFLTLWLPSEVYNTASINQVYILMILTLINVIINAYMYSIHSLYIALDKVKMYSLIILISSFVSFCVTLVLLKYTSLGVYAVAGTSTAVLFFVNLFLIPMYAEHILGIKYFSILKTILKNYVALGLTCVLFILFKPLFGFDSWLKFLLAAVVSAIVGYPLDFAILLNKDEKSKFLTTLKNKLRKKAS